jgi:hypothetical protein
MSRNRQLRDQVGALLEALGAHRSEVAASLCDAGVWGTRNDPTCCAVATYLRAVLGADRRVRSLTTGQSQVKIVVNGAIPFLPPAIVRIELPPPVRQFTMAFDRGMYPMLVRGPVENARQNSESTTQLTSRHLG